MLKVKINFNVKVLKFYLLFLLILLLFYAFLHASKNFFFILLTKFYALGGF